MEAGVTVLIFFFFLQRCAHGLLSFNIVINRKYLLFLLYLKKEIACFLVDTSFVDFETVMIDSLSFIG